MKYYILFLAMVVVFLTTIDAQAGTTDVVLPSGTVRVTGYPGGDRVVELYIEQPVTKRWAGFLSATMTQGFEEVTGGPAYYITPEIFVGLSYGTARYAAADEDEKSSHAVVSGFAYWETSTFEGELTLERYRDDPDPWYYQGYLERYLTPHWSFGVYGETDVGWGPRIAWSPHDRARIWLSPILKKTGESESALVGGIQIAF